MSIQLVYDIIGPYGGSSSFGVGNFVGTSSITYVSLSFGTILNETLFQNETVSTNSLQLAANWKFVVESQVPVTSSLQLSAYDKFTVPSIYLPPNMMVSVNSQIASSSVQLITYPDNPILFILN